MSNKKKINDYAYLQYCTIILVENFAIDRGDVCVLPATITREAAVRGSSDAERSAEDVLGAGIRWRISAPPRRGQGRRPIGADFTVINRGFGRTRTITGTARARGSLF